MKLKGSAHVLLDEGSGKIWTCSCWEKGNFIMINEFKYGQTWKIWPSPLSLWLYSTCNSLKIKNWFSYKNPNDPKFFLVYKFICASCVCVCVFMFFHLLVSSSGTTSVIYLRSSDQRSFVVSIFWVLLPSSFISVSESILFHLQRRKLQLLYYWRENDMI